MEVRQGVFKGIKLIPGGGEIVRAVGISALGIALAIYGIARAEPQRGVAALGGLVLLLLVSALLQVSRAVRHFHRQQDESRRSSAAAEQHYFQVLRRVLAAIEAREPYTQGRSRRIGYLARRTAEQMGLGGEQAKLLDLGGQVHDIGLLAVPDRVLNKPGRLGGYEFRNVKQHAEASYHILQPLTFLAGVLPAVRHHHERMNGTGYPHGLRGDEIPLGARILAVVDAFDAMTHDRPHRPALSALEALNELRRCAPAGYDPACVSALEEVMQMRQLRRAHEASGSVEIASRPERARPVRVTAS